MEKIVERNPNAGSKQGAGSETPLLRLAATDLAVGHQFGIWEAITLCAAAEADCRLLWSEDMQDSFLWMGVTIVNPFAKPKSPLLEVVLNPRQ